MKLGRTIRKHAEGILGVSGHEGTRERTQTTTESNSGGAQGSDTLFRATHPNHRGRDAAVILLRDAPKTVRGHDFVFYQSSMTKSPRG